MEETLRGMPCPACGKPFEGLTIIGDWGSCLRCKKRLLLNGAFQEAISIATLNGAWIDRIWWRISNSKIVEFFIDLPLLLSMIILPAVVFSFWDWRFLLALAPYVLLRVARLVIERSFPNLFAYRPYFIVSSRGIILCDRAPFFLPLSSILGHTWSSHVGSMTSSIIIEYATADRQVASIVLEGEERRQPLGELVEILDRLTGRVTRFD